MADKTKKYKQDLCPRCKTNMKSSKARRCYPCYIGKPYGLTKLDRGAKKKK